MKLTTSAKLLVKSQCAAVLAAQDQLGSSGRWPMPKLKNTNEASIFSEPYVAEALYRALLILEKRGYTAKDIGKLIPWPSAYARMAFIFRSRAAWKLSRSKQIDIINKLAASLATKYQSDHFCLQGKNILLSPNDQKTIGERIKKTKRRLNPKLVSQLDARLWMYTEMLYSRWHNLGHEFHGPYKIKDHSLLIKEWHDLNGLRKFMGKFPVSRITCYEFFTNNIVKLDFHNRLWTRRPFLLSTTKCVVEIDGKFATETQIKKLLDKIDNHLVTGAHYLEKLTKTNLKVMNAEMEFYAIKELLIQSGQSISPPRELIQKIKHNSLSPKQRRVLHILSNFYKKMTPKNIRIQFDPSI